VNDRPSVIQRYQSRQKQKKRRKQDDQKRGTYDIDASLKEK
jgi:hypothetical protein